MSVVKHKHSSWSGVVGSCVALSLLMLCAVAIADTGKVKSGGKSIKDPTRPAGFAAVRAAKKHYRLESVFIGQHRKVAIINGKSYREGDDTDLGRLMTINEDKVVISGAKKRHLLKLSQQTIKQMGKH